MANNAAWLTAPKEKPLKIDDAPMPTPNADEIVIRNHAIAINPVDWAIQATGMFPVKYPFVGGHDAAGEITEVGSTITKFNVGDRVTVFLNPTGTENPGNGALQLFLVAKESAIAKIPDNVSYAEASVLPLAMGTAMSGIFQPDALALPFPYLNPRPTGEVVLVWGGSSSVGACAIQLVKGAGFEVATTSNARNLEYCRNIGADYVFDYTKGSVIEDIIAALEGKDFSGAYCAIIDPEVIVQCAQITSKLGGNKFVATVRVPQMPAVEGLPTDVKTCCGKKRALASAL
jgi:NADPH:quinone reductase-like Zn-dependent oxidoreductase